MSLDSILNKRYYPKNATPIDKILYDYEYELRLVKRFKESIKESKEREEKELVQLASAINTFRQTKWYEERLREIRMEEVNRRKGTIERIRKNIARSEELIEEHLKNIDELSQLMIEYDGEEKDKILNKLKEIRWNNSKVDSGCFTTKPDKFYKYRNNK